MLHITGRMPLDDLIHTVPLPLAFAATAAAFAAIYASFAFAGEAVAGGLERAGLAVRVGARAPGQRRREALCAVPAILAFSAWTPILLAATRAGLAHIVTVSSPGAVAVEIVGLLVWNEVHFFAVHALLHTPWLYRRVHAVHHRTKTPSPFSTYAMHPVEGLLLGSVMPVAAFFVPLHALTVVVFPVVHLALNTLGHLGVARGARSIAARHARHHKTAGGEIGFASTFFDELTG